MLYIEYAFVNGFPTSQVISVQKLFVCSVSSIVVVVTYLCGAILISRCAVDMKCLRLAVCH